MATELIAGQSHEGTHNRAGREAEDGDPRGVAAVRGTRRLGEPNRTGGILGATRLLDLIGSEPNVEDDGPAPGRSPSLGA